MTPTPKESWGERFDATDWMASSESWFEDIKDFIRTVEQEAEERGYLRGWGETVKLDKESIELYKDVAKAEERSALMKKIEERIKICKDEQEDYYAWGSVYKKLQISIDRYNEMLDILSHLEANK